MIIKMSLQHFGGRGGASGASAQGGVNYLSADKTFFSEEPVKVTWRAGNNSGMVLSAETDGNGNIILSNAKADEYEQVNSKKSMAKYTMKQGITTMNENAKMIEPQSVGINWDAVKSVAGKTYEVKDFIKSKGFKWDKASQSWKK